MIVSAVRPVDRLVTSGEITVLVIDDHRSFAELLSGALNTVPGMRCVGIATSAAMGIQSVVELRPTVVVVDIQMPGQDGLEACRRLREIAPRSVIAVVTAHTGPQWISRAAAAGASAFISKDGSLEQLIDILSRAQAGRMLVAPSGRSAGPSTGDEVAALAVAGLTRRELEVLTYLGKGLHVNGIARVVGVSINTCRGYIKSLHSKLDVSTQLELVIKAQKMGLIGLAAAD